MAGIDREYVVNKLRITAAMNNMIRSPPYPSDLTQAADLIELQYDALFALWEDCIKTTPPGIELRTGKKVVLALMGMREG